jgi:FMN phosphatase YigB (HAD superfamily)
VSSSRESRIGSAPNFDEVDVVSFDLFETLILRPFEEPDDAFDLLEPLALRLSAGKLADFRKLRVQAKQWAVERNGEEVTLKERYLGLARRTGLDIELANALMNAELELEIAALKPSWVGKLWFDAALAQQKTVCVLSDTFYPRDFVERLLTSAGYHGWHHLYVSSEVGALKRSGRLFARMLSDLEVRPERVVHIGDDPVSDLRRASEAGLRTKPRGAPRELFARHAGAASAFPRQTLHDRVVRGLVARHFASHWEEGQRRSFVGPSSKALGYSLLGPLLLAFTTWLCRELQRAHADVVFFLARDGHVMKQAYDALAVFCPSLPRSQYLWASRRGTALPTLRSASDLVSLLEPAGSACPLSELLLRRFGLAPTDLASIRPDTFGFASFDETVHAFRDRERLAGLLDAVAPRVLERAAEERAALGAYYEERGLLSAERPVLVDLGHRGSLQLALAKLTGRDDFLGLYFATVEEIARVPQGRAKSYVGAASADPRSLAAYEPRLQMFELLFPGEEGSFVQVRKSDGEWRAETFTPSSDGARQVLCRDLHEGALEFLGDLTALLGAGTFEVDVPASAALAPYLAFLRHPTRADAECFSGVQVENAYSGRPATPVLARAANRGLWPEGARALGRADGPPPWGRRFEAAAREMGWSQRRLRKLLRDPRAFLTESRFGPLRWLGRRW